MALTTDPTLRGRNSGLPGLRRAGERGASGVPISASGSTEFDDGVSDAIAQDLLGIAAHSVLDTPDIAPARPVLSAEPGSSRPTMTGADGDDNGFDRPERPAEADPDKPVRVTRRSWSRRYVNRLVITDVVALIWASVCVHVIDLPTRPTAVSSTPSYLPFMAATAVLAVAWFLALSWSGSHDVKVVGHGPMEYKRVIRGSLGMFGLVAIGSYLFQLDLPRSYLVIMFPSGLAAILVSRYFWRRWLRRRRDSNKYMSRVLAVGDRHTVMELLQDLRRTPHAGYRVIGVCVADPQIPIGRGSHGMVDGVPVLGTLDEVAAVARTSGADTVAVTSTTAFGPSAVRRLSWELVDTDAELILAPALTNIAGPRIHTQPVAGLPLIHVDRPTYRGANRVLKKSFDVLGALVLLLLLSPLLIGCALAIKLTSKGPVFFRQERVGINGETFRMIKFRSMVVDAEARRQALQEQQRDAGNVVLFKMKNDPRITTIGKFIRRFSIDEVPQLFNVFTGDMSLVGPRPPLAHEVALYGDEARRRLLVKPGMTGLWQVSGRSDLTWDDTVRLDVYYVENWSITADLVILCRTAKAVFSSSGAY